MSERVQAKKSLGQNFLIDPNIQRKIISALDPQPTDVVLEIGPGFGAVTDHLLGRVGRLIVIELDDRLAERLRSLHTARPDFELVHDDALQVDFSTLRLPADFKAFAGAYGPIDFGEYLWVWSPAGSEVPYQVRNIGWLRAVRDSDPGSAPYRFWPEPRGLLWWGSTRAGASPGRRR